MKVIRKLRARQDSNNILINVLVSCEMGQQCWALFRIFFFCLFWLIGDKLSLYFHTFICFT